jgi:O-antigen/teichoic acid export membrane protein
MGFAFLPIYIKYLGMESFGLIGVFALLQAALLLLDAGLTPTLTREVARFKGGAIDNQTLLNLIRTVEIILLILTFLGTFIVSVCSEWAAENWLTVKELSTKDVADSICIMAFIVSMRLYEGIYRGCLVGLQKQVILNYVVSVIATMRGLGSVAVLVWISPTIQYYFFWQAIISIISVGALSYLAYRNLKHKNISGKFTINSLSQIKNYSTGMFGTSALSFMLTQTDKIIISKLVSLETFGYYSLASLISSLLFHIILPISQTFTPRFNEFATQTNKAKFSYDFHTASQLITVIAGSLFALLLFYSEEILLLWNNEIQFSTQTAKIISILAVGNFLNILMWMPASAYNAYGYTKVGFLLNLTSAIIIVPSHFIAISLFGIEGAAYIWVLLNLGYHIFGSKLYLNKVKEIKITEWYIFDILIPFGVIFVTIFPFYLYLIFPNDIFYQYAYLILILLFIVVISLLTTNVLLFRLLAIFKINNFKKN